MDRFPEHIGSNEVRPVTVAEDIHRVTVDEYLRIVRDLGWESTELIEGVVYDVTPEFNRHRTIDRFPVGEDADELDVAVILTR